VVSERVGAGGRQQQEVLELENLLLLKEIMLLPQVVEGEGEEQSLPDGDGQ